MTIRNIEQRDVDAILALNETYVHVLSPLDETKLAKITQMAALTVVLEQGNELAGFLIALTGNEPYESTNYQWFNARFNDFLYVDRIVVAPNYQGQHVASTLYQHVADSARTLGLARIVAEIDVIPPNEPSLLFHKKRGFKQIGVLAHSETKQVSLQECKLGS